MAWHPLSFMATVRFSVPRREAIPRTPRFLHAEQCAATPIVCPGTYPESASSINHDTIKDLISVWPRDAKVG